MSATVTLAMDELEAAIARAFRASATSPDNAICVAKALVLAEADGQAGHGLSRVPSYAAQARTGKVNGHAVPSSRQTRPGALVIDAANGFAYPALELAVTALPALARGCGIAAAAITRSHHFGVAAHPCERLAAAGLVALAFGNTPSAMSAWGGRHALFGTNPIAFAAPRAGGPPIVVDLALSHVARGKIMSAAQAGRPIPEGWALDAQGKPTTDARAALAGTLLPAGGAKGAALALMVELLAAALTGSNFASEASSFFEADGPPPGVGQLLLAIDPSAFSGGNDFAHRCAALAGDMQKDDGVRLPGARRFGLREAARRHGVAVDAKLLQQVRDMSGPGC